MARGQGCQWQRLYDEGKPHPPSNQPASRQPGNPHPARMPPTIKASFKLISRPRTRGGLVSALEGQQAGRYGDGKMPACAICAALGAMQTAAGRAHKSTAHRPAVQCGQPGSWLATTYLQCRRVPHAWQSQCQRHRAGAPSSPPAALAQTLQSVMPGLRKHAEHGCAGSGCEQQQQQDQHQ